VTYDEALAFMNELIEDYDNQLVLIELLSKSINRWENSNAEFDEFNQAVDSVDPAVSVLRVLMYQHNLGVADFPEVGSKSLVSKIVNQLDRQLIDALSRRFNISPALFFAA